MQKSQKTKGSTKDIRYKNLIEAFKDIGTGTFDSLTKDVIRPADFTDQLFGIPQEQKKYSGEITPGESLRMNDVLSGKTLENEKLSKQISLERNLRADLQAESDKKTQDLRLQLNALIRQVTAMAASTTNLSREVKIATMQATSEPGIYHIVFFQKLMEFILSFRKNIDSAAIWLHSVNKRAEKKNYWNTYKKQKGSFLLSPDHYLQRSAG